MKLRIGLLVVLCAACGRPSNSLLQKDQINISSISADDLTSEKDREKKEWINKVSKVLRLGAGLSHKDDLQKLMSMNREDIVAYFMNDPLFGESVLDFNLYFFGMKNGGLRDFGGNYTDKLGRYKDRVFDVPAAITAAREILKPNGNYLRLLDYEQPLYLTTKDRIFESPDPTMTKEQFSEFAKSIWIQRIDEMIALAEDGIEKNREKLCALIYPRSDGPITAPRYFGMPFNLFSLLRAAPKGVGTFYFPCPFPEYPFVSDSLEQMKIYRERAVALLSLIESLDNKIYQVKYVTDLKETDLKFYGIENNSVQMTRGLYNQLQNSSTNYNRRRAAYILKRYFCDDLTPINVVIPDEHSGGRHGSEASCQACHYKLDPMAGFFKDLGYGGYDFTPTNNLIRFDDMTVLERDEYQKEWKAAPASSREWNIGYIRSSEYESKNVYGETMGDLFKIIQTAPEVKRCIVKRSAEYILGENQVIDAGYLNHLSDEFEETAKKNSNQAMKKIWTQLLVSKTFSEPDRQTDQCYDYAPGESPAGKPPCRVAYLLQKNCVQCHGSTNSFGRLDLSKWIKLDSGKMSFPHLDKNGKQKAQKQTMDAILYRLTVGNSDLRMPLKMYMDNGDREQLVLWSEKVLKGTL